MLVHQRVYPKIASLVGKSIGSHWNFGCTPKHFQTHGYPKKMSNKKLHPPSLQERTISGDSGGWKRVISLGNWPIWVMDHFGLSSLTFHCQEVVLWKSYQQTLRVVGYLFLSFFVIFLSFDLSFFCHSCFVVSFFSHFSVIFLSFFGHSVCHFFVIFLAFVCHFLGTFWHCLSRVLSFSSIRAIWWLLSNSCFFFVHVWILLSSGLLLAR